LNDPHEGCEQEDDSEGEFEAGDYGIGVGEFEFHVKNVEFFFQGVVFDFELVDLIAEFS
jgi:hypothetical protein